MDPKIPRSLSALLPPSLMSSPPPTPPPGKFTQTAASQSQSLPSGQAGLIGSVPVRYLLLDQSAAAEGGVESGMGAWGRAHPGALGWWGPCASRV